ncbi:MAG: DNA methyltransferase, partial [Chloroflexota bacterium]
FGEGKQLGSVWKINRVLANERIFGLNGEKLHSTQKPAELLKRVILASSMPDDIVLDPFSGTGTTAHMAHYLRRQFVAIEQDKTYFDASVRRLANTNILAEDNELIQAVYTEKPPRIAFKKLLAAGYVQAGQTLYFDDPDTEAVITENAKLQMGDIIGTIHSLARDLKDVRSINGWKHWYYADATGKRHRIDRLRYEYADNST